GRAPTQGPHEADEEVRGFLGGGGELRQRLGAGGSRPSEARDRAQEGQDGRAPTAGPCPAGPRGPGPTMPGATSPRSGPEKKSDAGPFFRGVALDAGGAALSSSSREAGARFPRPPHGGFR